MRTQPTGRDLLTALILFFMVFTALGLAQRTQGVMRDEAYYFRAGEGYWGWFEELAGEHRDQAFNRFTIARYFAYNNEHPPLFKIMAGASWRLLHGYQPGPGEGFHPHAWGKPHKNALGWLSEISAFRLPGWLFAGLAVALIYLLGVHIEGRLCGLAAAAMYITLPRLFFHGQLCAFDSPIATMGLFCVYAYLRALSSARWGLLAGLVFGLALATKHNAWFIPALLLVHYLVVILPDVSLRPFSPPRIPLVFLSMAILGPLVFLGTWPWMWFDTVAHLKDYFNFHLHHSYYNIEYLGKNWGLPPLPISYPFVMTLFTVPMLTLLLALGGVGAYLKRPLAGLWAMVRRRPSRALEDPFRFPARRSWLRPAKGLNPRAGLLLVLNALFPIVLIALPSTPIFGGTKHWLTAYPFVALLAGVALARLLGSVESRLSVRSLTAAALCLLPALPGAVNIALTHPFGLTQYNALAGGPAGGADRGLNRQFWGYAIRQILPHINNRFHDDANLYFHDTNHDTYGAYIRDGLLRSDIRYAGMELPAIEASDYAIVHHELHFNKYDYWIWDAYGTGSPEKVLTLDGVPVLSLYRRPSVTPSTPKGP